MINTQNHLGKRALTGAGQKGSHLLQLSISPSIRRTYNQYRAGNTRSSTLSSIHLPQIHCRLPLGVVLTSWTFSLSELTMMLSLKGLHSACLASLVVGYGLMLFNHPLLEIINRLVLCTSKEMPQRRLQVTAPNQLCSHLSQMPEMLTKEGHTTKGESLTPLVSFGCVFFCHI